MIDKIKETIDRGLREKVFNKEGEDDFEFREGQREIVEQLTQSFFEDPNATWIIDAPTGAGKSLIALWTSWVITQFNKRGYIITSDLGLQDQYERDIDERFLGYPSVKGADNYNCDVNGQKFSLGECRLRNMSYEQAYNKLSCGKTCGYLSKRASAIRSQVSILNYPFWLIQRNYVEPRMIQREATIPFEKRDFTFFDEAHKIDEIVQSHFAPIINIDMVSLIDNQLRYLSTNSVSKPNVDFKRVKEVIDNIQKSGHSGNLFNLINELRDILYTILLHKKILDKSVGKTYTQVGGKQMPKSLKTAYSRFDIMKDVHCKIDDYIELINDVGVDKMVVNKTEIHTKFMCIDESRMIQKYLHEQSGFKVFMSATIGNPNDYAKIMGITNAKVISVPNKFSFKNSPIVYVDRHKLSFAHRDENLPKVVKILDKILDRHKKHKGIIHTGSYVFTNYIMENSRHAHNFINYEDSSGKRTALHHFTQSSNGILIGPSLIEGIDLKGDLSRFQIFLKVPYPNTQDKLTKAKFEHIPGWYDWKTSVSIMQGSGRSIRSEDDWAITYILDSCFWSLVRKPSLFPQSFKERIKIVD